ncbi:TPA: CDP-glycerol glycerophosphotransferase family protein [Campylobacter jejuni]|nr:CDP-glycerol glycerophosphotransferase family protein [Campylobacter jejuni]
MKSLIFYLFYGWAMRFYHLDKDYKKAFKFYEKASFLNPKHAKNFFKMGMCFYKEKNYTKSEEYFNKALSLEPMNVKFSFQAKEANSKNLSFIKAGELHFKNIADLQEELKAKGESFALYFNLANNQALMNDFLKAAQSYQEAINLCNYEQELSNLYYQMGFNYENCALEKNEKEYFNKTYKAYEMAIKYDKDLKSEKLGIGVFHETYQRWGFANRAYLKQSQYKQDDELFFKIGLSFDKLYDFKNAQIYYEKSLELNYQKPLTHFSLGAAYERQENFIKAAFYYEEALKRESTFKADWYYRLGSVLEKAGETKKALKAFSYTQNVLANDFSAQGFKALSNATFKKRAIYTYFYENLELKEKTILYESFHGRLMSCNPYAIFKALLKDERFKDFMHIWVISSADFVKDEFKSLKNLILVQRESYLYFKYLASAKYLINNTTFPSYFIRKENQFYLNTWHGTTLKTLGKYIQTTFMEHNNTQRNFLQTTHIINPNEFMQNVLLKDYDIDEIYQGKALISGYARCDLTLGDFKEEQSFLKQKQDLRKHFSVKEGEKVLLYAPTYRGYFGHSKFEYESITKLLKSLSVMPFKILFKGHHETLKYIEQESLRICDANDREIDTNELLSIVDILITDYSSIAFDFMVLDKPIIYYCYDYEEYKKERGMYFDLKDLGLEFCKDIEEIKALLGNESFLNKKNRFTHLKERFFPLEDGKSAKRIIDFYFFDCYDETRLFKTQKNKIKLLFFAGAFMGNGITSAFKNLLANVDRQKYSFHLAIEQSGIEGFEERMHLFKEVQNKLKVLPKVSTAILSASEQALLIEKEFFIQRSNEGQEKIFEKVFQREFKRLYGEAEFDYIIHYDGYNRYFAYLFAYAKTGAKKIIYLHNDMQREFYKRFPYLKGIFYLYKRFYKLLSVSKQTNEENLKLAPVYGIGRDKFYPLHNFINEKEVLSKSNLALDKKYEKFFQKDKVFINIARLSIEKDQTSLIEAFVAFHKKFPETKLLILGEGPLRSNLEKLISRCRAKKYIFLLGFVSNPYNFLKRSDFFVLSSQHEGLPLVLAEAMILGKKILCTDFACARDFLGTKNEYGLVVTRGSRGLLEGLEQIYTQDLNFKKFDAPSYNTWVKKEFEEIFK